MSSSNSQEPKQPGHGSSTTTTETIPQTFPRTLSIFTTGALRSVHQCGTCKKPISLSCSRLKHVAYCTAIDDSGGPCGMTFSTMYGCFKHPYRDGHNPRMKEHADRVKASQKSSASSPALSSLGRVIPLSQQPRTSSPLASASTSMPRVRSDSPLPSSMLRPQSQTASSSSPARRQSQLSLSQTLEK